MKKEDCYELGYILRTHGLKGEVVAFFDVDEPEYYEDLEAVFIEQKGKLISFPIQKVSFRPDTVVLKFKKMDKIEDVQHLKGSKLFLSLEELPELEDGFFFHEVIGYQVVDLVLGILGKVTVIYELPSQNLLAMDYKGVEVLIPMNKEIMLEVDKEKQQINVDLPEGLLEIYTEK
ncbi:MAG: 16S rRNA processing protein RimM [Bacteroidetes bacterium]|nr:MAG: 16S rRNA processing protein RimM [Bacteroidota bacterium]